MLLLVVALALGGTATRLTPPLQIAFFSAWVAAGVLNSAIALLQVFASSWADGDWIARSGVAGRAVGNLRQPNHLATLLLWSAVAIVPLVESGALGRTRARRTAALALMVFTVLGITLSGSRTGLVGIAVLALWGLLDRRLSHFSRGLLLAAPLLCAASWGFTAWWASLHEAHAIGAAARLGEGDLSASRFAIWRDTLELIRAQPWLGVGFGEFNFAWTLTPLPNRPLAFFDHTHNLPLQLAVELGLPLAALVLGLLGLALWQAWQRTWAVKDETGAGLRAAFVMVLLMALHSQLEYPLWYAHFLLPTAFMWGLCLGAGAPAAEEADAPPARWPAAAGIAMVLAAAVVLIDYRRVVVIFSPPASAAPLEERIADGQRSWFFAHHADYAAATTAERPADVMSAFKRAPHHLLDTRLMIAWATALAQSGDVDRARYIAARLREFHNPGADEFFAPCKGDALQPPPFQCEPPQRLYTWRDFR
ncbi:MAG: Wzy polymerase domain-containing protein [Burkholderiaceae bacterium]|nr:Wzy polymerase domain-containing protein [Burkholderiaceae bacterium]